MAGNDGLWATELGGLHSWLAASRRVRRREAGNRTNLTRSRADGYRMNLLLLLYQNLFFYTVYSLRSRNDVNPFRRNISIGVKLRIYPFFIILEIVVF